MHEELISFLDLLTINVTYSIMGVKGGQFYLPKMLDYTLQPPAHHLFNYFV